MSALKFRVRTYLEGARMVGHVELGDVIVYGPVSVDHLRGHLFEENAQYEITEGFALRLAEALRD